MRIELVSFGYFNSKFRNALSSLSRVVRFDPSENSNNTFLNLPTPAMGDCRYLMLVNQSVCGNCISIQDPTSSLTVTQPVLVS